MRLSVVMPGLWAVGTALVLALGSSACGERAGAPTPAVVSAPTEAADQLGPLRDYTSSYSQLIGLGGVPQTARWYDEMDIPRQPATASLSFNTGLIDQAQDALKRTRAASGGVPAVDQRADALIKALEPLLARLNSLHAYYEAKSYRTDRLARGKREDPLLRAEFANALAALRAFDAALVTARARLDASLLAAAKARGDRLGYATHRALQQAGQLDALFPDVAASRDPRVLAQADALAQQLETTLAGQQQAFAAAKARVRPAPADGLVDDPGSINGDPDFNHEQAARQLLSMIGSYRELRESHQQDNLDDMALKYNGAVESAYYLEDTR